MHSSDITGMLKKLCAWDYLESDNNGRWTIYKLKQKVNTSTKVDTFLKRSDSKYDSGVEGGEYSTKVDTSKVNTSKVDTSKVDTSKVDTSKVDTSVSKKVNRLSKSDLEQAIMRACKQDYVKMDEVAKIIGKSVDYLKNKIFPK